jgi:endonuclease YncB( thermonuclease family)
MPVAKVKKVIDGDTIEIKDGTRIRIANLNAPELQVPGGIAAKRKLQKILPRGTQIGISAEKAKSFGRSVREVTINSKPIIKLIKKKK